MLNFDKQQTALIFSPHPDDAEIAMGGTIAKMIFNKWKVIVIDLTDGEPTPYGEKIIREKETKLANEILGITDRKCLDLPNRYLTVSLENRSIVSETIRMNHPDIIFAPILPDWHPDHIAATKLIEGARFEAKFHKTELKGSPYWTPKLCYYFSPHRKSHISPSFIVDVTDFWQIKSKALSAYKSQIQGSKLNGNISLIKKCSICSKYFGHLIESEYGEPFFYPDITSC